jgi:AraC-like DNA-binding protein
MIVSGAQSVTRSADAISADPADAFFLNLPLSEGTHAAQDGRTARLAPSDFAIVDSTRPFELGFSAPFRQVSVQVPRELLAARGVRESATGTRIDGSRGIGAVASGALRALATDSSALDRRGARTLADHLCGLVALAVGEQATTAPWTAHEQLLSAALGHVEELLSDPDLAPRDVADRIAVSPRHLHRLFAERGTTFGRWLLERRLEHGRGGLVDPAQPDRAIADIAHAVGFRDPSYFARAFKARYGITPRAARQEAFVELAVAA